MRSQIAGRASSLHQECIRDETERSPTRTTEPTIALERVLGNHGIVWLARSMRSSLDARSPAVRALQTRVGNHRAQALLGRDEVTPADWKRPLAETTDGRTTFSSHVGLHRWRAAIEAHEAVHRAQFAVRGVKPAGTRSQLEHEAERAASIVARGDVFVPEFSSPSGMRLAFTPDGYGGDQDDFIRFVVDKVQSPGSHPAITARLLISWFGRLSDPEFRQLLGHLAREGALGAFLNIRALREYVKARGLSPEWVFSHWEGSWNDNATFLAGYAAGVMGELVVAPLDMLRSLFIQEERERLWQGLSRFWNDPVTASVEGFKSMYDEFTRHLWDLEFFEAGYVFGGAIVMVVGLLEMLASAPKLLKTAARAATAVAVLTEKAALMALHRIDGLAAAVADLLRSSQMELAFAGGTVSRVEAGVHVAVDSGAFILTSEVIDRTLTSAMTAMRQGQAVRKLVTGRRRRARNAKAFRPNPHLPAKTKKLKQPHRGAPKGRFKPPPGLVKKASLRRYFSPTKRARKSMKSVMGETAAAHSGRIDDVWAHLHSVVGGGKDAVRNAVAASGGTNALMLQFETAMRKAAADGLRLEQEVTAWVRPGTHIAEVIELRIWVERRLVVNGTIDATMLPLPGQDWRFWRRFAQGKLR